MKSYSVKMVDGTRYDFSSKNDRLEFDEDGWIMIRGDNKNILVNGAYIISITIMGDGDDS